MALDLVPAMPRLRPRSRIIDSLQADVIQFENLRIPVEVGNVEYFSHMNAADARNRRLHRDCAVLRSPKPMPGGFRYYALHPSGLAITIQLSNMLGRPGALEIGIGIKRVLPYAYNQYDDFVLSVFDRMPGHRHHAISEALCYVVGWSRDA